MSESEFGDIVQTPHEALQTASPEVSLGMIPSPEIKDIISRMKKALNDTDDGVAIAAPQIGENVRIFAVSPKIFEDPSQEHLIYINPKIIKSSKKKHWVDEGCLSVRWKYGQTHRHQQATVEALSENGEKFVRQGSGLLAQIFQHEIDHLDGIIFTDHARHVKEYDPQEQKDPDQE